MTITIHGAPYSTCTQRVAMTLEELEVPYDIRTVNILVGEHKTEAFLKLQPFGQIPVLEDSDLGTTIFESRAIIRYLAGKYGKGLDGTDAKSKALVGTWLEAEAQNFNPPIAALVYERVFAALMGGKCDEENAQKQLARLDPVLDILDKRLSTQQFLAGAAACDTFSIADIAVMPYLNMMKAAGEAARISSRPNLQEWANRVFSRTAWQRVLALATPHH